MITIPIWATIPARNTRLVQGDTARPAAGGFGGLGGCDTDSVGTDVCNAVPVG
ncbi:MAG TPA: hypothetical protein VII16_10485 [Actinomycetes bacterium]